MTELPLCCVTTTAGRADVTVAALWGISRGAAQRLLQERRITNEHGKRLSSGDRLGAGVPLTLHGGRSWYQPSPLPLAVLVSTADYVVVHKPAGLPVHALVPGEPSVVGSVVATHPEVGSAGLVPDGGLLHRLDNDTTGCLVLARSPAAHAHGRAHWSAVHKEYLAIVDGDCRSQTIDTPLRHAGPRMQTGDDDQQHPTLDARTIVTTACRMDTTTLVHLVLEGGRHHQLRAHLASIGHPLTGDALYGSLAPGPWHLHAWRLTSAAMAIAVEAPVPLPMIDGLTQWQRMDRASPG